MPSAAVLLSKSKNVQGHSNFNSRDKDKVNINYVMQARRDSKNAHGDVTKIKGLLTNISREKKSEGELMDRYYESRDSFMPATAGGGLDKPQTALSPRTLEAVMAERDSEMLRTGLINAQEKKQMT